MRELLQVVGQVLQLIRQVGRLANGLGVEMIDLLILLGFSLDDDLLLLLVL